MEKDKIKTGKDGIRWKKDEKGRKEYGKTERTIEDEIRLKRRKMTVKRRNKMKKDGIRRIKDRK